ncbi:hypothetical protein [Streptomyces vinaceus]|uniref:hypothetical protein n=1 Tax=Streptomyces vinaceus TaxID=1960 RepID=UPI003812D603
MPAQQGVDRLVVGPVGGQRGQRRVRPQPGRRGILLLAGPPGQLPYAEQPGAERDARGEVPGRQVPAAPQPAEHRVGLLAGHRARGLGRTAPPRRSRRTPVGGEHRLRRAQGGFEQLQRPGTLLAPAESQYERGQAGQGVRGACGQCFGEHPPRALAYRGNPVGAPDRDEGQRRLRPLERGLADPAVGVAQAHLDPGRAARTREPGVVAAPDLRVEGDPGGRQGGAGDAADPEAPAAQQARRRGPALLALPP